MKEIFNLKQLQVIELLALGELTSKQIGEVVGVSPETISTWKRDRAFVEEIVRRARELLKSKLPELYDMAYKKAKTGSVPSMKLLLDHLTELEKLNAERQQNSITFTWNTSDNPDTVQTSSIPDTTPSE